MGDPLRLPQIDDVQALWDRIAASPERIPVPDWQRRVLDERLAAHDEDPSAGVPWEQVRAELQAKYRTTP